MVLLCLQEELAKFILEVHPVRHAIDDELFLEAIQVRHQALKACYLHRFVIWHSHVFSTSIIGSNFNFEVP